LIVWQRKSERAEALAALMSQQRGPFIYYGEEIGMENITANSITEMMDIQGHTNYSLIKKGKSEEKRLKMERAQSR
jgi:trehalose-6-phosphate hydrolase